MKKIKVTLIKMTYTGLAPVKVAGVAPPGDTKTGKKKERLEKGDIVEVPETIARNLQHDPNWDSVNRVEMKYTGAKKTTGKVPGTDLITIKPGENIWLPEALAVFLDRNKNWERSQQAAPPVILEPPAGETPPEPPADEPEKKKKKGDN